MQYILHTVCYFMSSEKKVKQMSAIPDDENRMMFSNIKSHMQIFLLKGGITGNNKYKMFNWNKWTAMNLWV